MIDHRGLLGAIQRKGYSSIMWSNYTEEQRDYLHILAEKLDIEEYIETQLRYYFPEDYIEEVVEEEDIDPTMRTQKARRRAYTKLMKKKEKEAKYFPGYLDYKEPKKLKIIIPDHIKVERLPLKGRALPNSAISYPNSKVPDRKRELCSELRRRGHTVRIEDLEDHGVCPLRTMIVEEIDQKVTEELNEVWGKIPYTYLQE